MSINSVDRKTLILILVFTFTIFIVLLDFLFPLPQMKSFSKEIYAKDGTLLTVYLTEDDKWRMFTKLNEITPELKKAIIEKEDRWFYMHPGVNPISIIKALYLNITSGKTASGASTITMQLARLLERK